MTPYELATASAAAIAARTGIAHHDVAVILGSGWAPAADAFGTTNCELKYADIEGFNSTSVIGHAGTLRSVSIGDNKNALVFLGRTHYYEGHGVAPVVHNVRTAAAAGAKSVILTNAAGGLDASWKPGTAVLIKDHINLTATSPIVGAKFVDLTHAYSPRLRELCKQIDPTLGPSRMNRAVVSRAAAGLAAYLRANSGRRAVVGYDARHRSIDFAVDTCEILQAAGIDAHLLPTTLPTPLLAFAVRALGFDAGVMVTASHNPPQDNGYKVYLGDGSQIVPPADAAIAAQIAKVTSVRELPRSADFEVLSHDIVDAYVNAAASLIAPTAPRDVRVVSTSLHGVGHETWMSVMRAAGFQLPSVVLAQAEPDPEFPTVKFPNPEEAGAADLLLVQAAAHRADIAIAHDPDADRCAAGVFDPHLDRWRLLTGDELGTLREVHAERLPRAKRQVDEHADRIDDDGERLAHTLQMLLTLIEHHERDADNGEQHESNAQREPASPESSGGSCCGAHTGLLLGEDLRELTPPRTRMDRTRPEAPAPGRRRAPRT